MKKKKLTGIEKKFDTQLGKKAAIVNKTNKGIIKGAAKYDRDKGKKFKGIGFSI